MSAHKVANPPSFFVNISAADVAASTVFFESLAFPRLKEWSDAKTAAFRLPGRNENICLMLHNHDRIKEFMRPNTMVADAHTSTEALFSFTVQTKDEVDGLLAKAVAAGGKADPFVLPNYGADCGMYSRSFTDLDGHIWEVCTMTGECGAGQQKAE